MTIQKKGEKIQENEYKCDYCGGIFEKGWPDAESEKEAKDIFGKYPDDWNGGKAIVCDSCFQRINPKIYPDLVKRAKEII